jgi:hypothetical protein
MITITIFRIENLPQTHPGFIPTRLVKEGEQEFNPLLIEFMSEFVEQEKTKYYSFRMSSGNKYITDYDGYKIIHKAHEKGVLRL